MKNACTCHQNFRPFFEGQHHPNCSTSSPRPTYFAYCPTKAEKKGAREALLNTEALWDE